MPNHRECLTISIRGIVQGVGFRPFVYNLAQELHITGSVSNTTDGVVITAEGENLSVFIERLQKDAPPLSRVMKIDVAPHALQGFTEFVIISSSESGSFTLVSPDISVCYDCIQELIDPADRRFHYPFINCTNCGPRYSITESLPYDRSNTTMKVFQMCEACLSEYRDPGNRRFHAQPNACPDCGPHVLLLDNSGTAISSSDPIADAVELLRQGKIIAIKGLGGFHIACDATNTEAVNKLRTEKRRNNKPFALMVPDITAAREYCLVTQAEEELLLSPQRPVVLLRKREDIQIPEAVAPGNKYLGIMLPYTPLHYLLFHYSSTHHPLPITHYQFSALVMTSGNLSEEPIITSNEEAVKKLSGVADAFLVHNRDIFMRVDDSVVRLRRRSRKIYNDAAAAAVFIRRSRGYVPEPIPLLTEGPDMLGCGADVKNTFTLTRGSYALVSQHMGDMENYETVRFFEETLCNLNSVFRARPVGIAHDLHPGYFSTKWALAYAEKHDLKTFPVQHHYAHIGSVMAEHGLTGKVIGVTFDGNGYGTDSTLWGGEFLVADAKGFHRAGHLKQMPLPGGEMAVKEPWRMALSYMKEAYGSDVHGILEHAGFIERYGEKMINDILRISDLRSFSPLSSGAGRLFDAVSALIGICDLNTFEGEASVALESHVIAGIDDEYPVDIHFEDLISVDFSYLFIAIADDLRRKTDRRIIAAKFHNSVAAAIIRVVLKLSLMNNIKTIVLSGGVFQNLYLFERVADTLSEEGLSVYTNEQLPCNDACISLGQAYIAREQMRLNGYL